jgi:hypothetical protein
MTDIIALKTENQSLTGQRDEDAQTFPRMKNRQNVQKLLEELGRGRSPATIIVDGTSPSYWVIHSDDEDWKEEEYDNQCCLHDRISQGQHQLWCRRGGRGAMLRLSADHNLGHMLVWLIHATTGYLCLGVNFQVRAPVTGRKKKVDPDDNLMRRFIVVEDELSRDAPRLLQHLRRRGALELDINRLRKLLNVAPMIIVMPEARIDVKFWETSAQTVKRPAHSELDF